jgi:hypothetical protein
MHECPPQFVSSPNQSDCVVTPRSLPIFPQLSVMCSRHLLGLGIRLRLIESGYASLWKPNLQPAHELDFAASVFAKEAPLGDSSWYSRFHSPWFDLIALSRRVPYRKDFRTTIVSSD